MKINEDVLIVLFGAFSRAIENGDMKKVEEVKGILERAEVSKGLKKTIGTFMENLGWVIEHSNDSVKGTLNLK